MAAVMDIVSSLRTTSTQLDREVGHVLNATIATSALAVEREALDALKAENRQLREALERRPVIDQAKGILMGRHGYTADDAFAVLSDISRRERRRVRDVAASLVADIRGGAAPSSLTDRARRARVDTVRAEGPTGPASAAAG